MQSRRGSGAATAATVSTASAVSPVLPQATQQQQQQQKQSQQHRLGDFLLSLSCQAKEAVVLKDQTQSVFARVRRIPVSHIRSH